MFGFTEPYLFDRPIQAGFNVYLRKINYNQAKQYAILTGQNPVLDCEEFCRFCR